MRLRLLLYKAGTDGKLLDNAISAWTKLFNWNTGPYSHAEIWVPDENERFTGIIYYHAEIYHGTCYTSTMGQTRNKNAPPEDGVVKRPAYQVLKHPERWDYMEFDVPIWAFKLAVTWANHQVHKNKGYDKKAIASYFIRFFGWVPHSKDKFICSEFCAYFLRICTILVPWAVPSPRRLSRIDRPIFQLVKKVTDGLTDIGKQG